MIPLVADELSRPTRARGLKPSGCDELYVRAQSRPTRARGLKRKMLADPLELSASRPTRARGLKRVIELHGWRGERVAPHAGAWIETNINGSLIAQPIQVAPHAGAWIETPVRLMKRSTSCSRAPRGRVD